MSNADQRYQEKIRARAENRAPAIPAPVVVPEGAPADERYRAKLAARAAAAAAPKGEQAKPAPAQEEKSEPKASAPKAEQAKGEKPAK